MRDKTLAYVMAGVECIVNQAKGGMSKEISILPVLSYDRGVNVPQNLLQHVISFLDVYQMSYFIKWNSYDLGVGTIYISGNNLLGRDEERNAPTFYYMEEN